MLIFSVINYRVNRFFRKAYEIAAFGVTESDWDLLGTKALESFDLEIAKKAFFRVKNYKFLQLVYEIEVFSFLKLFQN